MYLFQALPLVYGRAVDPVLKAGERTSNSLPDTVKAVPGVLERIGVVSVYCS
jgi:hypothetical protein